MVSVQDLLPLFLCACGEAVFQAAEDVAEQRSSPHGGGELHKQEGQSKIQSSRTGPEYSASFSCILPLKSLALSKTLPPAGNQALWT